MYYTGLNEITIKMFKFVHFLCIKYIYTLSFGNKVHREFTVEKKCKIIHNRDRYTISEQLNHWGRESMEQLTNSTNNKKSSSTKNNNITGDRLRALRKSLRLRQEDVGEVVRKSKSTVAGYESGFRSPNKETLDKLAELYRTSVDYLLGRTDNSSPTYNDNEPRDIRELIKTNDFTYNGKKLDNKDLDLVLSILERIADDKS